MRKIEYIHTSVLHPHPDNPRKELGVLQNLTVYEQAEGFQMMLEKDGQNYYRRVWDSAAGFKTDNCPTPALDLIYEGLTSLGYEMSEEEIQMQDGTHPLFKKANDLIEAYKEEVKANE